ncbi:hypothetical protein QM012_003171 [Aureobasidium pullulans]|uniref:Palmitoyltransferase n=1 Tax=Aureobasidium pullulans TaxID=5580 RepID=A0ABR0T9I7_AURPU
MLTFFGTKVPWYYCFAVANIWARWFVKMPACGQQKHIYQVDWDTGLSRSCHRCLGHPVMPPRWYHTSSLGMEQCLPLYDHTCPWLGAAVYLHNFKAYVLAVTLLPLHFLTTFVFSIFGLVEYPHNRFTAPIVFLMLTSLLFAVPVATGTTARVWSEVIFVNRVMSERDGVVVRIHPDPSRIDDYEDQIYEPIPQDQILRKEGLFNRGKLANMHSLLGWNGSWWKAPAWMFLKPPVGRLIYLDDDHAQFWEPMVYFKRNQAAHVHQGESTREDEDTRVEEESAHHSPQSSRTKLARLMPSAIRRRNVGSDDYELGIV